MIVELKLATLQLLPGPESRDRLSWLGEALSRRPALWRTPNTARQRAGPHLGIHRVTS
jgi:hypothetical protein